MKLINTLAFGLVAGIAAGTGYWAGSHGKVGAGDTAMARSGRR